MTRYSILVSKTAEKQLNSLGKEVKERLKTAIRELEANPFDPRPKADIKKLHKLTKHDFYRLRVGQYRVVYTIENMNVKVIKIFSRERGYEWLK